MAPTQMGQITEKLKAMQSEPGEMAANEPPAPKSPPLEFTQPPPAPEQASVADATSEPLEPIAPPPIIAPPTQVVEAPPPRTPQIAEMILSPSANGNFYVRGEINRQPVLFVVDTGASAVSIPERLQYSLRLSRGRYLQTATANGVAGMYETQVKSLTIGPLSFKNVSAVLNPGAPDDTVLLGMTALREVRMVQQNGRMSLQKEILPETEAEASAPPPPKMKKSVKDCMGGSKVINEQVLKCMQGADEAAGAEGEAEAGTD
ncbi:retropepsin-like aspartic protease family protein [Methylomagnum sp.]